MSSLIDLSCAVDQCSLPIEVIRFSESAKSKGRPSQEARESRFSATMSVQPMTQKEQKRLPEGVMASGSIRGFTTCELMTVSTSECREADHIIAHGVEYEVRVVEDWSIMGGYFEVIATRVSR